MIRTVLIALALLSPSIALACEAKPTNFASKSMLSKSHNPPKGEPKCFEVCTPA